MNVDVRKTVPIEFIQVVNAYRKVKQGGKAAGIDNQTWEEFDKNVERNLYVIWNRPAPGSYHPQAVREVEIPKKDGKMRKLGIPTLGDRIAQQVVKEYMEKRIDGVIQPKEGKGTPQGGVISPLLANLYLHYALDVWLTKHYAQASFVRYADDMVVNCNSQKEAEEVLQAIRQRLAEVKLQIKEEKTRIAYCKDYRRNANHATVKFEFLGFSYQPRARKSNRDGKSFMAFAAEISQSNQKKIRAAIKEMAIWRNTTIEMRAIANQLNAKLRGWINYYGKYSKRSLRNALIKIDQRLIKWIRQKHKSSYGKSAEKLKMIKQANPAMFYHWQQGY